MDGVNDIHPMTMGETRHLKGQGFMPNLDIHHLHQGNKGPQEGSSPGVRKPVFLTDRNAGFPVGPQGEKNWKSGLLFNGRKNFFVRKRIQPNLNQVNPSLPGKTNLAPQRLIPNQRPHHKGPLSKNRSTPPKKGFPPHKQSVTLNETVEKVGA